MALQLCMMQRDKLTCNIPMPYCVVCLLPSCLIMNKTKLAAALVAVALAGLAGTGVYSAWQIHRQLDRIQAALPAYPILQAVSRTKSYSFWQSEERVSYQLGCDKLFPGSMFDGARPGFTLQHTISHNPLAPGVHTELVWSQAWQDKLQALYGKQPPLSADTRMHWNGTVESVIRSPGFTLDRDGRHIQWQGLNVVLQYDRSLSWLDSRMTAPGFRIRDDARQWQFELQASEFHSRLSTGSKGLLLGKDRWQMSGMLLRQGAGEQMASFSSGLLSGSTESREQQNTLQTAGKFSWVGLHVNDKPLGDISSDASLSRLNADAVRLSQQQTLHQGLLQCQASAHLLSPEQRSLLVKLLSDNPAFALALALATPDGTASLQLDTALKGLTEADLQQERLSALQDKISLQASLSWPQALPERWVNDFAPADQRDALVRQYRDSLASLLQSGHLRHNGKQLETRFDLIGGKLLQNGLPMAGLSPLAPPVAPGSEPAPADSSAPAFDAASGAPL